MKKKFLSSMLAGGIVLSSLQTGICVNAMETDNNIEQAITFGSTEMYEGREIDYSKVVVILKKEYSFAGKDVDEKYFNGIDYRSVETISSTPGCDNKNFRTIAVINLKEASKSSVEQAINALKNQKEIYYAGPEYVIEPVVQYMPNDPCIYNNGYVQTFKSFNNIGLFDAWDITTGNGVVVANNEKLMYDHEDIKSNMWVNPSSSGSEKHGFNFDSNGKLTDTAYDKVAGHGTLTAGIIAATKDNGKGGCGVAPNAKICSVTGAGQSNFAKILEKLEANNIKILNISLSGWTAEEPQIIQAIENYNGLIVISAGNDYKNIDNSPSYPASYAKNNKLKKNVISVAAVDENDKLHSYSNYGISTVDIAAPADIVAPSGKYMNSYGIGGGTSSAAPLVAGVAALVLSVAPHLTGAELKEVLLNNVDVLPNLKNKVSTSGRINAYKAVTSVTALSGEYFIRNISTNTYLDATASSDYKNVITHTFKGGKNQIFKFENSKLICSYNNKHITFGSDLSSVALGSENNVYLSKNSDGTYCIISKYGDDWYALEGNSNKVSWNKYNKNITNQKWSLEKSQKAIIPAGDYYIMNTNSGRYLDLNESTGKLLQHGLNYGANQKWRIQSSGDSYTLKTLSTVKPGYIGYSNGNSPAIISSSSMKIDIYEVGEGENKEYRFHFPNYTYLLSVKDSSTSNYADVIWDTEYNANKNETWTIVPVK
ncbi:MAG: S8 family serine peptidase [Oscillospiraceae bacterium]|nr:S8 family serine peptidase [Oscillospiraceae bacterium]